MQSFLASFHFRLMIQSWFWIIHKCELNWVLMRLKQIRTLQSCIFSVLVGLKSQRLDWNTPIESNNDWHDQTIHQWWITIQSVWSPLLWTSYAIFDWASSCMLLWFSKLLLISLIRLNFDSSQKYKKRENVNKSLFIEKTTQYKNPSTRT